MIHLPAVGSLWFALTLHGLNINVSINQVIMPLVNALGGHGSAARLHNRRSFMSGHVPLVTRRREVYLPEVGAVGFWIAGVVAVLVHDVHSHRVGWHFRQSGCEAESSVSFNAQHRVLCGRCTL